LFLNLTSTPSNTVNLFTQTQTINSSAQPIQNFARGWTFPKARARPAIHAQLVQAQSLGEEIDDSLGLQQEGNVVNGRHIVYADDLFGGDATEHRDLVFCCWIKRLWAKEAAGDLGMPDEQQGAEKIVGVGKAYDVR
jgi:hypothetical protein